MSTRKGLIRFDTETSNPGTRTLAIIRHGRTKMNAEDVIRGWYDIPLDKVGIQQAQDLGEEMRKEGIELDGLISSDLQRTVQTAFEVSKETGIPLIGVDKFARPWNVGDYTGKPGKEAHKVMSRYAREMPDEKLPNGESFNEFKYRFISGTIAALNKSRGLKIGVVSHSRGERILNSWVAAGCSENMDVDLDVFLSIGEEPGTCQLLEVTCSLVLS